MSISQSSRNNTRSSRDRRYRRRRRRRRCRRSSELQPTVPLTPWTLPLLPQLKMDMVQPQESGRNDGLDGSIARLVLGAAFQGGPWRRETKAGERVGGREA